MALNVKGIVDNYINIDPITEAGDTFNLPAGVKRVEVFRDAGIIYEGANPDEYSVAKKGVYIKSITLATALTGNEILKINAYK